MKKFLSQAWFVILSALITLGLGFFMSPLNEALSNNSAPWGILSLQFAFSPERFAEILSSWNSDQMKIFWKLMRLDYLFPLAYSMLLAGLVAKLTSSRSRFIVPLLAAVFDYAENTTHVIVLMMTPISTGLPVLLASLFASFKYGLILLSLGLIAGALAFRFATARK